MFYTNSIFYCKIYIKLHKEKFLLIYNNYYCLILQLRIICIKIRQPGQIMLLYNISHKS